MITRKGDLLILRGEEASYVLSYLGTDATLTLPTAIDGAQYQIRAYAFYGCSALEGVILGAGVNRIGVSAFDGCESLTTVWYEGDADGWNAIAVGDGNEPLESATRYFYSDVTPTDEGNYWHYSGDIPTVWVR